MSIFSDFGITQSAFTTLVFLYSGLILLLAVISAVLFSLKGYGIYKMSRKLEVKGKWRGFVPVLNVPALGSLADSAAQNKKGGLKKTVTAFYLLYLLFAAAAFITAVSPATELLFAADIAVKEGTAVDPDIFYEFATPFIMALMAGALYLVYRISVLVCCYKIFKVFSPKSAVLFTVLALIFAFLIPCFLYSVCKNDPEGIETDSENEDTVTGFEIYNEQ